MDKRKLIGTIIGVMAFIALIAGATFAWFNGTVTVQNGTYNATAQNFIIKYENGTDITNIPMLASGTASGASSLVVSAYRETTTATGNLLLKLTTSSSNAITTSGALHYAVCTGTSTAASCTASLETAGSNNVLATGVINASGEKTLYTVSAIPTTKTYYWIFFWFDGELVTNAHLGQTYSGYIHASATQN